MRCKDMRIHSGPIVCCILVIAALQTHAVENARWVWDADEGWIDLRTAPADTPQDIYRYARGLMVRGDLAAAEEFFLTVERRFPDTPWARRSAMSRALCLARRGRVADGAGLLANLRRSGCDDPSPAAVAQREIELLQAALRTEPEVAMTGLAELKDAAPLDEQRQRAQRAYAEACAAARHYDAAREEYERILAAQEQSGGETELHFRAALMDLFSLRDGGLDRTRVERAQAHLSAYLARGTPGERLELAQAYAWLLERVVAENDPSRLPAYFAATCLADEQYITAMPILRRAARAWRGQQAGEVARFFLAEALFRMGRTWDAFLAFEDLLQDYPATTWLGHAVAREFALAERLASGGDRWRAMRVFDRVADHMPGGPLADDATLRVGDLHASAGEFEAARVAYDSLVADYPRSELYYEAIFKAGRADLMSSESGNDNEELLARAERSLTVYLERQPDGPYAAEARRLLKECTERQAAARAAVARFYARRGKRQAAEMLYRDILRRYPDTSAAIEAEARLKEQGAQKGP